MKEKDKAAALVDQYRATGKINYLDLAHVLEDAWFKYEADEALKHVRPQADKFLKIAATGESEVPVPVGIVELAYEAAMIASGYHRPPGGAPPKSQFDRAGERAVAEAAIVSTGGGPGMFESVINDLMTRNGMSKGRAIENYKAAKKRMIENGWFKKPLG